MINSYLNDGEARKPSYKKWRTSRTSRVLLLESTFIAMKKGPLAIYWYIGDEKLPSYIGIIINHYKDPY